MRGMPPDMRGDRPPMDMRGMPNQGPRGPPDGGPGDMRGPPERGPGDMRGPLDRDMRDRGPGGMRGDRGPGEIRSLVGDLRGPGPGPGPGPDPRDFRGPHPNGSRMPPEMRGHDGRGI